MTKQLVIALILPMVSKAGSACLPVASDHIMAGDLVETFPEFSRLPAQEKLGFAPMPGVQRNYSAGELRELALRHGIRLSEPRAICIARPLRTISEQEVLAALREAVGNADAHIELVDFLRTPVPTGELAFAKNTPVMTSTPALDTPVLWRGHVQSGDGRTFPFWARARVTARQTRLVAAVSLPAGRSIEADQVRLEQVDVSVFTKPALTDLESLAGKWPRRTIPAGQPITPELLAEAPQVVRGATVRVRVVSAGAQLSFDGEAVSSGGRGAVVMVKNRDTGKQLKGLVTGKGEVTVDASK